MMTKIYKVGIYLRLSKEDDNKEESNSIGSQREILTNYIIENHLTLIKEYVDDGITGTTFNRNGFNQMIRDIIAGKINMVLVKDLSRLGRDHIEFGTYVERFFPEHRVRLVALGDMYDSDNLEKNNTTMILFKSMYNEMYVKDISDKIKMSVSNKRKMGQFLGATAPFGYQKDENDYHKLIIDEYAASIVQKIFYLFIQGKSITNICRTLTKEEIPIPSIYKRLNRGLKSTCFGEWTTRTVTDILTNPTYIGNLTQGRLKKVNYKSKKMIHTKKENWIITHNTCPKIIDEFLFKQAQNLYNSNKGRTPKNRNILLKGLVICKECNHTIGFRTQISHTKNKTTERIYGNCNYYLKHRYSNACTPHNVSYRNLENIILEEIQTLLNTIDKEKLTTRLEKETKKRNPPLKRNHEIKKLKQEINSNIIKLDKMYLDKLNSTIEEDMYQRISKRLKEQNNILEKKISILEKEITQEQNQQSSKIEISKYLTINRNLITNIIDHITIDEMNNIEIYYKMKNYN